MIVPINIELDDFVEAYDLSPEQTMFIGSSIIDAVTIEYRNKWDRLIDSELHSTRSLYRRGVFIERESPLSVVFGLRNDDDSPIPLMIEEGKEPFDMKEGFSRSPKAKQSKNGGWYLNVPFRHATPQAVAESGIFNSIMPQRIYDEVKERGRLSFMDLPAEDRSLGGRKKINRMGVNKPAYLHKSPIYEGLTKVNIASTANEKRSGYFTWRRVSNNSDENSWWNGGIVPYKLMDKAIEQAQIDVVVDKVLDNFLNAM